MQPSKEIRLQDEHSGRQAPLIDRWDEQALILAIADQRAERFRYDDTFRDGDTLRMGEFDWQVIAAPGHDTTP